MLDYTKAAIKKTVDDFRRVDYVRNLITQILYIFYLAYALFTGAGNFWANAVLGVLSLAYFIFFLIVTTGKISKAKSKTQKTVALIFTRCKQLIKLFTLGVMLYGIYATTTHVTALSVILSALMIVGWILQLVFEVVFKFFINRAQFILEGMEADYEALVKPVKTVGNFFKKMAGKEIEQPKEPSKARQWLDKKVAQTKSEKVEKKKEEKRRKKQEKTDRRNTKFYAPPKEKAQSAQPALPEALEVFEETPQLTGETQPQLTEKTEKPKKKRGKKAE